MAKKWLQCDLILTSEHIFPDQPPNHTYKRLVWDWPSPAGKLPNSDHPSYALCPKYPDKPPFLGFFSLTDVYILLSTHPFLVSQDNRADGGTQVSENCNFGTAKKTIFLMFVSTNLTSVTVGQLREFSAVDPFIGGDKRERWSLRSQAAHCTLLTFENIQRIKVKTQ